MNEPKVLIFTHIPSPYQVEFFNAIAEKQEIELHVVYLYSLSRSNRSWKSLHLNHENLFIDDDIQIYKIASALMSKADLVIFNYYQHSYISQLIHKRSTSGQPWCFWGERPGYHQLGLIGRYYRQHKLSALHRSQSSIWGVGKWAIEQYRHEFGLERLYYNLPYFSNLERFSSQQRIQNSSGRSFLFSGSLIHRKGVDLLANAFSKLADEFPSVNLSLIGEGELRPKLEKRLAPYSDRVKFWGFQAWEALPQFYQAADVLCVPSRYDGWALVVPEGLAAGLPVISTTRTGAAIDLLEDNKNGWLILPGNSEALYQAMRQAALLSDTELQTYSQFAKQSASRHSLLYGVNKFSQAVKEALNLQFIQQ